MGQIIPPLFDAYGTLLREHKPQPEPFVEQPMIDDKTKEEIKRLISKLNSTSDIAGLLNLPEDIVELEVEKL